MKNELIWLAYDKESVDRAWERLSIQDLYFEILSDQFRKKVDTRTILFHNCGYYLLENLEALMKRGAIKVTLLDYLAELFKNDILSFPGISDELFFDYQLIRFYTKFNMVDDDRLVENVMTYIFRKVKLVPPDKTWALYHIADVDRFFETIRNIKRGEIKKISEQIQDDYLGYKDKRIYDLVNKLIQNYIEFFHYAKNNRLELFCYNNLTDTEKWGDLIDRKNERNKKVIKIAYKEKKSAGRRKKKKEPRKLHLQKGHSITYIMNALINDFDPIVKQKAAETLGSLGDKKAVNALIEALSDEEPDVRAEACKALGELSERKAIPYLIDCLHDDSSQVVLAAANSLFTFSDKIAIDPLISALLGGVTQVAVSIAFFKGIAKDKRAGNTLIKNFKAKDELVRRQIAFILGRFKGKKTVDLLIDSLENDKDSEVRLNAATSLSSVGQHKAIKPLKKFFKEEGLSRTLYLPKSIKRMLRV